MSSRRRRLGISAVVIIAATVVLSFPVGGQEPGLVVSTVIGHAPESPIGTSFAMAAIGSDLYFYDYSGTVIWKRDAGGQVTILAGAAGIAGSVDGVGSAARLMRR